MINGDHNCQKTYIIFAKPFELQFQSNFPGVSTPDLLTCRSTLYRVPLFEIEGKTSVLRVELPDFEQKFVVSRWLRFSPKGGKILIKIFSKVSKKVLAFQKSETHYKFSRVPIHCTSTRYFEPNITNYH